MSVTSSADRSGRTFRLALYLGLAIAGHAQALANMSPVIEASQAAFEILQGSDILLLDARVPDDRARIRLSGAVFANYRDWQIRNRRDPGGDGFLSLWRDDLAHLGIGPDTRVLIFGGRGSYNAPATVWYALQAVGVAKAVVVNGGFEALAAALPGSYLDWAPQPSGPDTPASAPPGVLEPALNAVHCARVSKEDVLAAVSAGGLLLLDTRSPEEFAGLNDTRNARPGRIPGAINVPHSLVRTEKDRIKSPGEIRKLMDKLLGQPTRPLLAIHGNEPMDLTNPNDPNGLGIPIVVYCQGGGRSAFLALALVHAGYRNVRNYFGSFGEWSRDHDCPVETGLTTSPESTLRSSP